MSTRRLPANDSNDGQKGEQSAPLSPERASGKTSMPTMAYMYMMISRTISICPTHSHHVVM